MIVWDVDPAIFEFAGREVRWYGLLFALGLLILGPQIEEKMWQREKLKPEWMNSLYLYVVIGTIVGARLGHVLFYDPAYYLANPLKIFAVWEGGLASHGGTLGIIIALWIYSKKVSKKSILWILDRIAVPTGLAAALIRIGNLMNSEIFGRPTDLPWAFSFVRSGEYRQIEAMAEKGLALTTEQQQLLSGTIGWHPTQIYEAIFYLIAFGVSLWLYWKRDAAEKYTGLIFGVFMIIVFGSRILVESIKIVQETWELELIASIGLNMGQLLSVPFVLVGLYSIWSGYRNRSLNAQTRNS